MQTLLSLLRADAVLGLGAAGLNLVVASVLVMLSLVLCVVVSLLAGLPTGIASARHRRLQPRSYFPRDGAQQRRTPNLG